MITFLVGFIIGMGIGVFGLAMYLGALAAKGAH